MIQLATRLYASEATEYKKFTWEYGHNVHVGIYGHGTMNFIFDKQTKKIENMPCSGITTFGSVPKMSTGEYGSMVNKAVLA